MSEPRVESAVQKMLGACAPKLVEVITHLAFHCGWPRAMSAIMVAKEVLGK